MSRFSFASLNKEPLFTFDASIINELHPQTEAQRKKKDARYTNLEELYKKDGEGVKYQIRALYINTKSEVAEESPVAALSTIYVNIPLHQLEAVKEMRGDKNAVAAINDGYAGFYIRPYKKTIGKKVETFYSAVWCDVEPEDFEEPDEDFT